MNSNTDLEKAWFLYKTEAQLKGMSTNEFCQIKGIPYHEFERWYKKTHRTVTPVEVIRKPEQHDVASSEVSTENDSKKTTSTGKGDLLVNIKNRRSLCLSHGGLNHLIN